MNKATTQKPAKQDFIVMNVTLGPHFVSDIRLNFDPLGVIDLTWENSDAIQASNDLRKSLRLGVLRQITRKEWDDMEEKKIAREKASLAQQRGKRQMRSVTDADGNERIAETLNPMASYNKTDTVPVEGYANDSLSYATALDIAQAQAEAQGYTLTAQEFAERVKADSNYVPRLLNAQTMSVSGDPRRGRAVVAMPGNDFSEGSTVQAVDMTNFINDGYVAGHPNAKYANSVDVDLNATDDDEGFAEEIDLLKESPEEVEQGAIKRV
jgi:hypothetical protein